MSPDRYRATARTITLWHCVLVTEKEQTQVSPLVPPPISITQLVRAVALWKWRPMLTTCETSHRATDLTMALCAHHKEPTDTTPPPAPPFLTTQQVGAVTLSKRTAHKLRSLYDRATALTVALGAHPLTETPSLQPLSTPHKSHAQ
jgi:hypothetical protein